MEPDLFLVFESNPVQICLELYFSLFSDFRPALKVMLSIQLFFEKPFHIYSIGSHLNFISDGKLSVLSVPLIF